MKVFVVLALVVLAAATALAFGSEAVGTSVSAVAVQVVEGSNEPAALLLSGSALIGLAGAVKRLTM